MEFSLISVNFEPYVICVYLNLLLLADSQVKGEKAGEATEEKVLEAHGEKIGDDSIKNTWLIKKQNVSTSSANSDDKQKSDTIPSNLAN